MANSTFTRAARTLGEFSDAVRDAQRHLRTEIAWARGHSRDGWKLKPGTFRSDPTPEAVRCQHFRSRAGVYYANAPDWDDHFAWLAVMQHYKVATRLLDWTDSPVIAAWFALQDVDSTHDSAVWMMNPINANAGQIDEQAIATPGNEAVKQLAHLAFAPVTYPERFVCVMPRLLDSRMAVQGSRFSIHGAATPIEETSGSDRYLAKIVIPASSRRAFDAELLSVGIRPTMIYPDLQGLAMELSWFGPPKRFDMRADS